MNKILITLFVLFASFSSHAENDIENARRNVATSLNGAVKDLKNQFKPLDTSLNTNYKEMTDLDNTIDELVEKSDKKEINPTVLIHGDAEMKTDCNYDSENLNWTGSKWTCLPASISTDCIPASDEYKEVNGSGYPICVKKGSYVNEEFGWGACNNSKGEQETIVRCLFENKKNKQQYQVDSNLCSNKVDRFKQACGENGGNSSCKCPDGYFYDYLDGSGVCKQKFAVSITSMSNSKYAKTSLSTDGKLSFRLYSPDGGCMHNKAIVKLNIDKDRLTKVTIPSIFMARGAWVWVNGKLLRKRLYGVAGASSKPTGSGVGDKGFDRVYPGTGRKRYESSHSNGHGSNSWRVPHGKTMCGIPYSSNGTFGVKGSRCVFTCDTKNASDRNASNINIPLDYLNDGANEFIFENVGSNGTLLQGTVVFEEAESSSTLPLPKCKI